MSTIVLINGPVNAGKTTVAQILADKLENCSYYDADQESRKHQTKEMPELIECVMRYLTESGLKSASIGHDVILSGVVYEGDFNEMKAAYEANGHDFYTIVLSPSEEVCANDRGDRILSNWERTRIRDMYEKGYQKPDFADYIIDNSEQTPEETAQQVMTWLEGRLSSEAA